MRALAEKQFLTGEIEKSAFFEGGKRMAKALMIGLAAVSITTMGSAILMYIGLAIVFIATIFYILVRLKVMTPVTVEDIFAGFMIGQLFFNFGLLVRILELGR